MKTNNRQLQSPVLLTLCLMVLLLGGCRERRNQETPEEVVVTAIPTATAVTVSAIATFTPTNVPDTPTPVPTNTPIPPPTAVPTVEDKRATVNTQYGVNLRAGPGTTYARVGFLEQGAKVTAIAQTRDRQWIQLENGWVFHNLLDGIPADLPLPLSIPSPPTPTPLPPTATATPAPSTSTPVPNPTPRLGDFEDPFKYGSESVTFQDGLRMTLKRTIYNDEDEMQKYMETPFGQNCRDCLALELEIRNVGENPKERVVQEDFKLVRLDGTTMPQKTCTGSRRLSSQSVPLAQITKISPIDDRVLVYLCFSGLEGSKLEIVKTYRLSYTHNWIAPTPTPTPTSTRERSSRNHVYVQSVITEEKRKGWTWIQYFALGPDPESD